MYKLVDFINSTEYDERALAKADDALSKLHESLSKEGKSTFDDFIDGERFSVSNKAMLVFNDFILAMDSVFMYLDREAIFNQGLEIDFWKQVFAFLQNRAEAFSSFDVIYSMGKDKRFKLYEEIFNNDYLYENPFFDEGELGFSEESAEIAQRVIGFSLDFIIEARANKTAFIKQVEFMYRLQIDDAEFLWQMIENNKAEMRAISMFNRVRAMNVAFEQILGFDRDDETDNHQD